jgi:hypothetical protein
MLYVALLLRRRERPARACCTEGEDWWHGSRFTISSACVLRSLAEHIVVQVSHTRVLAQQQSGGRPQGMNSMAGEIATANIGFRGTDNTNCRMPYSCGRSKTQPSEGT